MAAKVTKALFYGIGADENFSAIYKDPFETAVEDGDYLAVIHAAIAARAEDPRSQRDLDAPHVPPERFLNLHMGDETQTCVFAFRVAHEFKANGRPSLRFVEHPPFIPLTLNFPGTEAFLTDFRTYEENGERRWASFVCDLAAARASDIAFRIRQIEKEAGVHPDKRLCIPFMFNVVDTMLGFSPWAIPGHEDHPPLFTHGGVHPNVSTYLTLRV